MRLLPVVVLAIILTVAASAPADGPSPGPSPGGGAPGGGSQQAVALATLDAASVHSTFAIVRGGMPAYSEAVTVEFQYGPTTGYGQTSEPQQIPATGLSAGLEELLGQLTPNTLYHYRLVVITSSGPQYANDATLTTLPPAPVQVRVGSEPLTVVHGHTQMDFGCSGEPDDTCQGHVQLVATHTLRRHHRRVHRRLVVADDAYTASVGHALPYPYTQGIGTVTIHLNRNGRRLLAKDGFLRTRATFTVERGHPITTRVFLEPKS